MRYVKGLLLLLPILFLMTACSGLSTRDSVPLRHPEELDQGRVNCLECHDDETSGALKPYSSFPHTAVFLKEHGSYAAQGQNLCSACHPPSWCQTCHAGRDELKPGIKYGNRPDLGLPHRGDFIIQHQKEGRTDPGLCLTCHGNRNNRVCGRCHN